MSDMDAYKDVFLAESAEYLQAIIEGLLALETDPSAREPVEIVFRGAHSLKGMAGAMGYSRTSELTHKMESVMDRVRRGDRAVDGTLVDTMLAVVDVLRDLIADESAGGSDIEIEGAVEALLAIDAAIGESTTEPAAAVAQGRTGLTGAAGPLMGEAVAAGVPRWAIQVILDESCVLKGVRAYMVLKRLAFVGAVVTTTPSLQDIEDERFDTEFAVLFDSPAPEDEIRDAVLAVSEIGNVVLERLGASVPLEPSIADTESDVPATRTPVAPKLSDSQTVRISISHLDTLVDLVGELVTLRSRLGRMVARANEPVVTETFEQLYQVTEELQAEVMRTRMVPVGNIFNRFPRMVRDLARELGKQAVFELDGMDIELDRTVLDEIGDPIVHLLRNSVDHGLESPEERVAVGKDPVGVVTLTAAREREHVLITISDDGRGMSLDRIWNKAVERGLAAAEDRPGLSDDEILGFCCMPGFSTAEIATTVSGRGVGLDVVKGKIEYLGGSLIIRSRPGGGTEFVLRLPLTLAIIRALLVASHGQTFAVPLASVTDVFSADEIDVQSIDGHPVVVARDGHLVPLHRLDAALFGVGNQEALEPRSTVLFVDSGGGESRALHVGLLQDRQEIVVKPLTKLFADTKGFSGAAVLGDGSVALVIDPRTIFSLTEARS